LAHDPSRLRKIASIAFGGAAGEICSRANLLPRRRKTTSKDFWATGFSVKSTGSKIVTYVDALDGRRFEGSHQRLRADREVSGCAGAARTQRHAEYGFEIGEREIEPGLNFAVGLEAVVLRGRDAQEWLTPETENSWRGA